jgi:hypothetical protein
LKKSSKRRQQAKERQREGSLRQADLSRFQRCKRLLSSTTSKITTLVAALGTLLAFVVLKPSLELSQGVRLKSRDLGSQTYEIKNTSLYSLKKVRVYWFIHRMETTLGLTTLNSVAVPLTQTYSDIPSGDKITLTLAGLNTFTPDPTLVTQADIGVVLFYAPSLFGSWEQTRLFRLEMARDEQGNTTWHNQPADEAFRRDWSGIAARWKQFGPPEKHFNLGKPN